MIRIARRLSYWKRCSKNHLSSSSMTHRNTLEDELANKGIDSHQMTNNIRFFIFQQFFSLKQNTRKIFTALI